jgi:hypothetical protein
MDKTPFEWFQLVEDLTDKLTVKRILAVLVAGVLATLITLLYENRGAVFAKIHQVFVEEKVPTNWTVGAVSQRALTDLVIKNPSINMILVTEIDLQKNRRLPRFWYVESKFEPQIRAKVATLLPQPVFDTDQKNTQQIISVLNNEFSCTRTPDTVFGKIFPFVVSEIQVICRLAVPPFYGRFVGILTIGVNSQLTKSELEAIRLELARLSTEIYIRDVLKKELPQG